MKSSGFDWFPDEPSFLAQADAIKATGLQKLGCKSGMSQAGSIRGRLNCD